MKKSILPLFLIFLVFTACGPKSVTPVQPPEAPASAAQEPAEPVPGTPAPVNVKTLTEGLVVFTSGDVFVTRDGEEEFLDIGDQLFQGDIVGTGPDSYCEIQLGEIAVVRMESDSLISMSSLFSSENGSRMGVDLEEGQVLCKVKKLLEDDSFKVKAGTVVCGVRGTEFGVSSRGDEQVLLAVKEGAVAVTPASLEKVAELADQEESLKGVAVKIQEASLVVGAAEEVEIQKETFQNLEEIAPVIEQVVQKIEEKKVALERGENMAGTDEADPDSVDQAIAAIEKEVTQKVEEILSVIEKKPEIVAPAVLEKKVISEESRKVLETTDEMELISYTAPAAAQEAGTDKAASQPAPVMPSLYKVVVRVEPENAEILSSGRVLARGKFSKLHPEGKKLSYEFRLEGYKPQTLDLTVDENTQDEYLIKLEPQEEQNTSLPMEAPSEETPVTEATQDVVTSTVSLSLVVQPADASISINGTPVGTGRWDSEARVGDVMKVNVQRNGYAPATLNLTVPAEGLNRTVSLEPRPLEVTSDLSSASLVASLTGDPSLMIGADSAGKLTAFNRDGKVLWQYQSGNSPNANSSAVLHNGKVYFSGGTELVVLNSSDGSLVARIPLEESRSHIYGRQVMPLGEKVVYPANDELIVMDGNGKDESSYGIPEGSSMSSSLWKGKILIADKKGSLLVMDPENGAIVSSVSTGSLQAVAQSPAVQGDRAVFASRKGVVSAIDLAGESVLWERNLDRTVFANIVAAPEGCYVYTTKREVYALSWDTGEDLFAPLQDISAAPGYAEGMLYVTTRGGQMQMLNALTGSLEGAMELNDAFTAKPIIRDGIIFGVGSNGKFYRINTAGIE